MKSEMEKLREKQQRRRQKRTLRIVLLSPVIAFLFVAVFSLFTRIDSIVIRNSSIFSATQLYQNLSLSVGDSLFSVKRDLSETLSVRCPYVKTVSVEYCLPNRVEIVVTPAAVTYALRTEKEVLLLDEDMKVLEVVDRLPDNVLKIDGVEITSYKLGYPLDEDENIQVGVLRRLITSLRQRNLYDHVSVIDFSKKYNLAMKLHGVISVSIGNSEDIEGKLNLLVKLLNENDVTVPAEIRILNASEGRYSRLPTEE